MAEKEQDYRHSFYFQKEENIASERKLGLKYATWVSLAGLLCCFALAVLDHPWVAGFFGMGSVLGIVTVLVQSSHNENISRPKQKKEK